MEQKSRGFMGCSNMFLRIDDGLAGRGGNVMGGFGPVLRRERAVNAQ
jgi:hypothetical protein